MLLPRSAPTLAPTSDFILTNPSWMTLPTTMTAMRLHLTVLTWWVFLLDVWSKPEPSWKPKSGTRLSGCGKDATAWACEPESSINDTSINHTCFPKLHRTDVYWTNPSTNSEYPVPSTCYRKGKCRKDIDSTTGLWYNEESHDLPAGKGWAKGGTWSKILYASLISLPTRSNLTRQWVSVIIVLLFVRPLTWRQRGEHIIDDELVFSNHTGYIFHDSRGIESGGTEELETLKEFIRRKCGEKRLRDRLHAIWLVLLFSCLQQLMVMVSGTVSQWMAIDRGLIWSFMRRFAQTRTVRHYKRSWWYVLKHFEVPVIVVFTKYDQFLRNVQMDLSDDPDKNLDYSVSEVAEERFQEHYLRCLGDDVGYVRLESELHSYLSRSHVDFIWKECTWKVANVVDLLKRQLQHWMRMLSHWCF